MATADPREILAHERMGAFQWAAIFVCVLINAMDGFDILAISFASPGIATEWGIDRAALGVVLSMELIGMAAGSILLGNVADRVGRRPLVIGCLVAMTIGMMLSALASNIAMLSISRLMTGIGIGGTLPAVSALSAEYANTHQRALAVTIMAIGNPIGSILGGSIAAILLESGDWRPIFWFGAAVSTCLLPIVWFLLPESISYLAVRRPANALARINTTLKRMGHGVIHALPDALPDTTSPSLIELFTPRLRRTTIILIAVYFCHIMTFYFLLKWLPKIIVDMGYLPAQAGSVLVWATVGNLLGGLAISLLSQRFSVRAMVVGAMITGALMLNIFGRGSYGLHELAFVAASTGVFTSGALIGVYALMVHSFPTELRAGGTGIVIGLGRGGAILGPIIAGILFQGGSTLGTVALVMSLGSLLGAALLLLLKYDKNAPAL